MSALGACAAAGVAAAQIWFARIDGKRQAAFAHIRDVEERLRRVWHISVTQARIDTLAYHTGEVDELTSAAAHYLAYLTALDLLLFACDTKAVDQTIAATWLRGALQRDDATLEFIDALQRACGDASCLEYLERHLRHAQARSSAPSTAESRMTDPHQPRDPQPPAPRPGPPPPRRDPAPQRKDAPPPDRTPGPPPPRREPPKKSVRATDDAEVSAPGSAGYAWEKFEQAVDTLATSPGALKARLVAAALYLERLEPDDLPTLDMVEEFQAICFAVGKGQPTGDEGSVAATVEAMTHQTARDVARRILDLREQLGPYRDT